MDQLQFVELDEGGRLVVTTDDGTRYAVPVDDRLRAALRPRPSTAPSDRGASGVSLREVQSMIRAGQSAQEVASVTGWDVDRVRRFEGPVLAEREHVIGLAQRAPVRAQGRTDGTHTLDRRVRERLQGRDVELAGVTWDAARSAAHGPWTVQVIFSAGGRERRAAWHYELQTRALDALDDEARWLSEDEQALPGGLAGHPLLGAGHGEDEAAAELMATMRERRQRRSRRPRKDRVEVGGDPGHVPGQQSMPPEVLPLEDLPYDPDTMGDPPSAHPGGAAPESPSPPTAPAEDDSGSDLLEDQDGVDDHDQADDSDAGDQGEVGAARQQRRRLRLPSLPEAVDPPVDQADEQGPSYAHLRDPGEVSFEEFFEIDEELDEELEARDDVDSGNVDPDEDASPLGPPDEDAPDEGDLPADGPDDDAGSQAPLRDAGPSAREPEPEPEPEPDQSSRPAPGRKGRTSVPSWDDIMFGARDRG